jgi:hypothetical protein
MTQLLSELSTVVARVDCAGERHFIRWEAGQLVALSHDDPEGERALVALGGPGCTCLDVLDAWSRQHESAALLTALSRGTRDPVRPQDLRGAPGIPYPSGVMPRNVVRGRPARMRRSPMASGWVSVSGVQATAGPMPGWPGSPTAEADASGADLVLLANLGHPMTVRLVATVTASLLDPSAGGESLAARPVLTASLFGRAWTALRDWLADPDLELELSVIEAGQEPVFERDNTGPFRVALPLDWVVSVWGRDLTIVAGRFSLGVIESTASRTTLLSIGPDFETPKQLVVELR